MGFINMDLGGAVEPKPVPGGTKYDLVVSDQEPHHNDKSGKDSIKVTIGIVGHEDAPSIRQFLSLPHPTDGDASRNFKLLMIKRFLSAFNIPFEDNGFNPEDLVGAKGLVELGLETSDDGKYTQNTLVLPKLTDGSEEAANTPRNKKTG